MKRIKNLCALIAAAALLIIPMTPAPAAMNYSTAVKNARLDAVESTIGASAILKVYTGSKPSTCADTRTGTVLATISLPADWMAAASGGSKAKLGTWTDTTADATGTAGYWTIFSSDGTTCGIQGTFTLTGGGGDMTLDSVSITAGQEVTIGSFSLTSAN
ncbi:hypothetical protein [Rhizorhabdus histidinilytica]|uniref:hypothetical protein n=1 Tax=Rhizorhabdus histidinilytica TaxID=439228 RepID=UPI00321FAFD7